MAIRYIALAALLAMIAASTAGAQSIVCHAPQIANYSGAKLVGITGNIGWVYHYYNFTGFSTAQIIYPKAINYTSASAPGSSYLLYADYKFNGPGNLSSSPALVFVLLNNTQQGCASMHLFAYSDVVMPYDNSKLITAQQATSIAQKAGYNITFRGQPTLVPTSNRTGIQMLAPGYSFEGNNFTVYANAENGTIMPEGNVHLASNTSGTAGLNQGFGSTLQGIYSFFRGIFDWIIGLLGKPNG